MVNPNQVSSILLELKSRLRFSRARLAKELGSTPGKVYNLEHGRSPSPSELEAVTALLARYASQIDFSDDSSTPTSPPETSSPDVTESTVPVTEPSTSVDWSALRQAAAGPAESSPVSSPPAESTVATEPEFATVPDDGARRFSNSEIQTFQECRRKWWLAWYRGFRMRRPDVIGVRSTGTRIHLALAEWYVPHGQPRTDPREALERAIAEDAKLLTQHVDTTPADIDRFEKSSSLERAMVEGYVDWLQETGADQGLRVIASEQYVEADMPEFDIVRDTKIIGKIDVRVRRESDGVRLFKDHKTVADFTGPMAWLHMNPQMLHYHLLEWLSTEDGEARCDGALYNMLRRVKRTATAKPPFYERLEVRHNRAQLESYKRRLSGVIGDIYDVEESLESLPDAHTDVHLEVVYPRPTSDCRWKCDFFGVCSLFDDGSRAEAMLTQHFEKGDPLEYYKTEIKNRTED